MEPAQVSIQAWSNVWWHEILENIRLDIGGGVQSRFEKKWRIWWDRGTWNVHSIAQSRWPRMDPDQSAWFSLYQTGKGFLLQNHDRFTKSTLFMDRRPIRSKDLLDWRHRRTLAQLSTMPWSTLYKQWSQMYLLLVNDNLFLLFLLLLSFHSALLTF